ncbi:MAG TPA: hypothetical protein VMT28_04480 [Terriglobales bacterium]|nr:hypothetical protein [Terriglobales bacterium]
MAKLDAQGIATLIEQLLASITAVGPAGIELFLKLQSLFTLGPDEQANVAAAIKAGLAADTDTIAAVEAWKQQVGL